MKKKEKKINIVKNQSLPWVYSLVVGVLICAVVFVTIQTATSGAKLVNLDQVERGLLEENEKIIDKYVQNTSLLSIEKRADELGFIKPHYIFYIPKTPGVARLP